MRTHGRGVIQIERTGGRCVVSRLEAHSPLRLLTPRGSRTASWVFTSTFGGGLLAADSIELDVTVSRGATCYLGTQSQTKVYRSESASPAEQRMTARIDDEATLVCLPDAIVCFRNAAFRQTQRIDLKETGSLCWLDWFTSGRLARGERWDFRCYSSRIEVLQAKKMVFLDSLRLAAADGSIGDRFRMGACDCFATALLLGPRFANAAKELLDRTSHQPVAGESVLFSASPLRDGAVLRIAGPTTESVSAWLRERLGFIATVIGDNPWERKW